MSTEARLYHIEQQTEQLNQQVKLLKQLITTEVLDLRKTVENQVADVRQVVMYQDKLYQEKINKLETRIQQLSEFCLHLARSNGCAEAALGLFSDGMFGVIPPEGFQAKGNQCVHHPNDSLLSIDDVKDDNQPHSTEGVLEKYKSQIERVYDFYTTSNIDVFHPTMSLTHFTHFVKDCQLCGLGQGTSAELLWMTVLRSLNDNQKKRHTESQVWSRSIANGINVPSKQKKKLFAFQRLETIPKHLFGDALVVLALERHRQTKLADGTSLGNFSAVSPLGEKTDDIVTIFLLYQVFPYVESAMNEKRRSRDSDVQLRSGLSIGNADHFSLTETVPIQVYKTDAVKSVLKDFLGKIKESFSSTVKLVQGPQSTAMNVDGFVEVARRHELLPLIRKPDLRHIFLICSAAEKEKHLDAEEGTISVGTFVLALYYLADKIYGDSLLGSKFLTPESRMKKLLTKMYLLN